MGGGQRKAKLEQSSRAHLLCQGLHGGDVHTASLRVLQQHPEDGKLSTNGFPASRGGAHKHVVVAVIDGVKHWGWTKKEGIYITQRSRERILRPAHMGRCRKS